MPWILNLVYLMLVTLASPVLLYRSVIYGKYRDGWAEKLIGQLPKLSVDRSRIWFHAVSVGEVLQLRTVLAEFKSRYPKFDVVISTTTSTGHAVAVEKFPQHTVCYFPLDFSWSVRRAIQRIQPTVIVLVELELWPNFILRAANADIPLVLINGRISERSHRGYRRIGLLTRRLLGCFDAIAAQNGTYAERVVDLGAPAERVSVTGTVKFDHVETDRRNAKTQELGHILGIGDDERVLIAGSTQAPEEEFALDTWQALRSERPDLRLVLVPRHQERFNEVARLVENRDLPLLRRSQLRDGAQIEDATSVLLLDTLGELGACWGLADIAFVGGSLTDRGGQNMIEPAGYGAAVLFGPNTRNFHDVVEALLSQKAARVVADRDDLTRTVARLLDDPELAHRQGLAAQEFVLSQQGATTQTVETISAILTESMRAAA